MCAPLPPPFPLHSKREWPLPRDHPSAESLRIGTFNVQVDHDRDEGTGHEWVHRRPLAAKAIKRLDCDLLLLQEPGPPAASDIQADLGDEFRVLVHPCDPTKWRDPDTRKQGQAFDGNGFIWRPSRLEIITSEVKSFFLSTTPDMEGGSVWDGSEFCRTGVEARFRDRVTGHTWHAISAHFDHVGKQARVESAKLVMARAAAAANEAKDAKNLTVIVGGDFNTFPDAYGPETYAALATAAESSGLLDVRASNDVEICDFGVNGYSWKGWSGKPFSREENVERYGNQQDASRFDHLFVSRHAKVTWTGVVEEADWANASDHVPILLEARSGGGIFSEGTTPASDV
eukprot:TRINITY_DN94070_c0_g1_i1.p1 TRINITY_DN94070_c0_g1~~TRINITY_DN94070_c0_g1_i1.p1  ORF type:complete len:344 (-),score=24.59 TRINITY_DN94070_c0_g1_i1:262-1293(-)